MSHTFHGTSQSGNFQEALDKAIGEAQRDAGTKGADMLVEWTLHSVKGKQGGIAGVREIEVTITTGHQRP